MFSNELKNLVISDKSKKYEEINKKIIKFSKIYFYLLQNYSPQLFQIDKVINFKNFGEIKITQLLENQHNIIKELVRIINEIIIEKINSEVIKKLEENSTETFCTCSEPIEEKRLYTNNNSSVSSYKSKNIYIQNIRNENKNKENNSIKKNNPNKSVDHNIITKKITNQRKIIPLNIITPKTNYEFNGALTFLNINNNKISDSKPYEIYLNKKKEIYPKNPVNVFDIVYKKKIKNKNKNKSCMKNKSKSCVNHNDNYLCRNFLNSNYTIDEEKIEKNYDNNERQISIITNMEEESSTLPEMLNKKKKSIKYRNEKIANKNRKNDIPFKNENNRSYVIFNTLSNFTERSEGFNYHKRNNTSFNFFRPKNFSFNKYDQIILKLAKHKVYSVPYINNGKINSPSKLTKNILGAYYKKLKDYNKK